MPVLNHSMCVMCIWEAGMRLFPVMSVTTDFNATVMRETSAFLEESPLNSMTSKRFQKFHYNILIFLFFKGQSGDLPYHF